MNGHTHPVLGPLIREVERIYETKLIYTGTTIKAANPIKIPTGYPYPGYDVVKVLLKKDWRNLETAVQKKIEKLRKSEYETKRDLKFYKLSELLQSKRPGSIDTKDQDFLISLAFNPDILIRDFYRLIDKYGRRLSRSYGFKIPKPGKDGRTDLNKVRIIRKPKPPDISIKNPEKLPDMIKYETDLIEADERVKTNFLIMLARLESQIGYEEIPQEPPFF